MNKFINDLALKESENIKKIYGHIDITLEECVKEFDQEPDSVRYDQSRGLFIVPMKKDQTMFLVISHNALSTSLDVRYVDRMTNQETSIANLIISIDEAEIKATQQSRIDLIEKSDDSYMINNLFWNVTDRILHEVDEPTVDEVEGLGTLVSKNSDTDLIAVDNSGSLIQE